MMESNNGRIQFYNTQTQQLDFELDVLQQNYISKAKQSQSIPSSQIKSVCCLQEPVIFGALIESNLKLGNKVHQTSRIDLWHLTKMNFSLHSTIELDFDACQDNLIGMTKDSESNPILVALNCTKHLIVWRFTYSKWIQINRIQLDVENVKQIDILGEKICILGDNRVYVESIHSKGFSIKSEVKHDIEGNLQLRIHENGFILYNTEKITLFFNNNATKVKTIKCENFIKIQISNSNKLFVFWSDKCEIYNIKSGKQLKLINFSKKFNTFVLMADGEEFIALSNDFILYHLTQEGYLSKNANLKISKVSNEKTVLNKFNILNSDGNDDVDELKDELSVDQINKSQIIKNNLVKQIDRLMNINPIALPKFEDIFDLFNLSSSNTSIVL